MYLRRVESADRIGVEARRRTEKWERGGALRTWRGYPIRAAWVAKRPLAFALKIRGRTYSNMIAPPFALGGVLVVPPHTTLAIDERSRSLAGWKTRDGVAWPGRTRW